MILLRIAGFIAYDSSLIEDEVAKTKTTEPIGFEQLISLLEVIIWPLTIFLCLLLFKNQIAKIIGSLGSIKAGTQGIELNFIEEKLQEATKLIGIGPSGIKAKGGSTIKPKSGGIKPKSGGIKPKGSSTIVPSNEDEPAISKRSQAETPYQELISLQDNLNHELNDLISDNDLRVSGTSNFALTSDLIDHAIISDHTGRQLKTLIELIAIGLNSPNITYDHVTQIRKLYNNISF